MRSTTLKSRFDRHLLCAASLCSIMYALPAFADTPAVPPVEMPFSWTGVYVGASIGHTAGTSSWYGPAGAGTFGGQDSDIINHHGTTYGGEIGYNYQIGHGGLVGVEASFDGTSQNAGNTYTGGEGYNGATAITVRNTFAGDVSARLGATVGHLLLFGKAGVGYAKYDYSASGTGGSGNSGSKSRSGFLVGGGAEFALSRHWSIKLEYNHVKYSAQTVDLTGAGGSTFLIPIGETANTVKGGINFRF